MKTGQQWDIRGAVTLGTVFHFLHASATGCLLPFFTLYLRHLGLTATMTGVVMATKHLITLVWRPIACVLARQYNKQRALMIGSLLISPVISLTVLLLPSTGTEVESGQCNTSHPSSSPTLLLTPHLTPHPTQEAGTTPSLGISVANARGYSLIDTSGDSVTNGKLHQRVAFMDTNKSNKSEMQNDSPFSQHQSTTLTSVALQKTSDDREDKERGYDSETTVSPTSSRAKRSRREKEMERAHYEFLGSLKIMDVQHQLFFLILIVVGLWEAVAATLEWTADDGLYEYLDFVDATDRYGSVGFWRLLGGACGVCGGGVLVSMSQCIVGKVAHFYAYACLMILTVPAAALLPIYQRKRERRRSGGLKALQLIRGDALALLCALGALLAGVAGSAVTDFLFWTMEDRGGTELHMGAALATAGLCQALFTLLSKRLGRLVKPPGRGMLLGTVGLALQCLYYSFLWAPWSAMPVQLLAGLSNGALWWAVQAQCEEVATPGKERAMLKVYQTLAMELGAGLGSLASGVTVQRFGLEVLFQGTAVILSVWAVCLAALQWKIPRQRRINYSRLLATEASECSDTDSDQERDWLERAIDDDKGKINGKRREL